MAYPVPLDALSPQETEHFMRDRAQSGLSPEKKERYKAVFEALLEEEASKD